MTNNLVATASVLVSAGPEKVWRALTDPAIIKRYMFGSDVTSDWEVGSALSPTPANMRAKDTRITARFSRRGRTSCFD